MDVEGKFSYCVPIFTRSRNMITMQDEASYTCTSCGEDIVLPIDLSAGSEQEYVEDCPVCCHPNLIHVEVGQNGDPHVWVDDD